MSRMLRWEVWNFMSVEHGVVEFDERNIINFKGYNDSGKSAMLNALKVLLFNANPTKQVDFIQDDKDYFRVVTYFDDDVKIMRDKYKNGQSLYELYKGEELLVSTKDKKTGALARVSEVPKPIADYLGLITYENICLNARSCFEKLIGVQTTGSENYKMFNTILKSEELASASSMLNNDKNKVINEANRLESSIAANKELMGIGQYLSQELVDDLKAKDKDLDTVGEKSRDLSAIVTDFNAVNSIVITPEIEQIDVSQLVELESIINLTESVKGIKITPEMSVIDTTRLDAITQIQDLQSKLSSIRVSPEVDTLGTDQLEEIFGIKTLMDNIKITTDTIQKDETDLELLNKELNELIAESNENNFKLIKCPNCGTVYSEEEGHVEQ